MGSQLSMLTALDAGVVKSTKMTRTIVVRRNYLHYVKKYARCMGSTAKRHDSAVY